MLWGIVISWKCESKLSPDYAAFQKFVNLLTSFIGLIYYAFGIFLSNLNFLALIVPKIEAFILMESAIEWDQKNISLYMVGNVSVLVKNIYIWQTVCIHIWSETHPVTYFSLNVYAFQEIPVYPFILQVAGLKCLIWRTLFNQLFWNS